MSRLTPVAAICCWLGSSLLIAETRWARRRPLADRIAPYLTTGPELRRGAGLMSVGSFRDVLTPLAVQVGGATARLLGIHEDLATRLARIHAKTAPPAFRLRQLAWALALLGAASAAVLALAPPPPVALLLLLGLPTLAFLVVEQHLAHASKDWQDRLFAELPIVAEQLGMLLSAGYSLGASVDRVARRGRGCAARDLRRVSGRVRQGLSESESLTEWADVAGIDAVQRLVGVLALNREAADLGRLVSDEARSTRREAQRRRIETIERRGQQVWIPVTVAALVPGVLFLAVPFLDAMRMFGAT